MTTCRSCSCGEDLGLEPTALQIHQPELIQFLFHKHINTPNVWPRLSVFESPFGKHFVFPPLSLTSWPHQHDLMYDGTTRTVYFLILLLLLLPTSTTAAAIDTTVIPDGTQPPQGRECHLHFGHRVRSCVHPFLSRLHHADVRDVGFQESARVVKHLCVEYQLALLCLHSALTECPTLDNLKRVQSALGSRWVASVNRMCSILVQPTMPHDDGRQTNSIPNHDLLKDAKLQSSKDFLRDHQPPSDNSYTHTKDSQLGNLSGNNNLVSPLQREESSKLERPANGGSRDVQLKIYNYVNNYQYDTSRSQPEQERFRPTFLQVMLDKSSGHLVRSSLFWLAVTFFIVACIGY